MTTAVRSNYPPLPPATLEERRRRKLDEHRRVAALSAPLRDPAVVMALAKVENKLLDCRAEAESLRILDSKRHRKAIKRLENQERSLEAERLAILGKEQADNALYGEAKEPILRAIARGEDVVAADVETAEFAKGEHGERVIERRGPNRGLPALAYSRGLRARNLAGLEHAFMSGHLQGGKGTPPPEALKDVGERWAEAYVIACGQATARGEGGGGFGPKAPQPKMVEAGELRAIMAGTLTRPGLRLSRMEQRHVEILDSVCGKDVKLRDLCRTRGVVPAMQRRLRHALTVALQNLAIARERGEVGKAAAQLMAVRGAIAAVR